ncbi:MAG: HAD-IA family hydrolase [Candidatus Marinimicrobia bacterium]|nr:HAD-IA family hydrolase [Candidatus Neomarinimicrobiota bacterium]MCF7850360.1 HAD-IA family hydrolase [Candidatus Neomarinimicrobiota bacterium]MCF7904485.1 HAD-IA family hydrolase [Candidatus Neomarinimicrobiota bacterium]
MLKPVGFLFDLDGTLVDTSRDISANLNRAFDSFGYPQLSHETILSHVGYGANFLVTKCLQHHEPDMKVDNDLITEIWEKFRDHYRGHLVDESTPYPGVLDFLKAETRPMGVVSNKPEEFVIGVLRELDMTQYFTFMWGKDTLPVWKPDPEVIKYGIFELGLQITDPVCMVGDNPVDTQAAKGAGTISVALASGFTPRDILAKAEPDHLFPDFSSFAERFRIKG